jgi:uncharacterized protein YjbI with pentapeptide repeats
MDGAVLADNDISSVERVTMIRFVLALGLVLTTNFAVQAQDAAQIARVQTGQSCSGCNLFQADLAYRDLPDIDVSGARLRQADLSLATMNRANFDNANMSVANLFGARVTGSSFRNTDLSNAVLVGSYFGSSNLSRADLSGANLSGAEMASVTGLTQTQLNSACGDAATQLPAGLHVSPCQ